MNDIEQHLFSRSVVFNAGDVTYMMLHKMLETEDFLIKTPRTFYPQGSNISKKKSRDHKTIGNSLLIVFI